MNVINDNWLFVRYLDNEVKQISIKQAFQDAEKILDIETPIFHDYKCQIYDVCTLELLTTILKATYYKPKYKFIAGKDNFQDYLFDNWNIDEIVEYLNEWQHRFNLFDNEYPFLQDISLLEEVNKQNNNYIAVTNPICPGGQNIVFGKIKTQGPEGSIEYMKSYSFDSIELIYILLYTSIMGTSTAASQYPNTGLSSKVASFIIPKGKNLKETLSLNCFPLKTSDRPNEYEDDIFYDRPIWELNIGDFEKFDITNITKNVLICTFFPGMPMLAKKNVENNIINNMVIGRKEIFNKDIKNQLKDNYVNNNPWSINKSRTEKDGSINISYDISILKIIDLCIALTNKLTDKSFCNLLDNNLGKDYKFVCNVYYRELDNKYRSYIITFGNHKISSEVLKILENDINHEKAIEFQNIIKEILNSMSSFKGKDYYLSDLYTKTVDGFKVTSYNDNIKNAFSLYAEEYFFNTFIPNINDEDILKKTAMDLTKYMQSLVDNINTNDFISYSKGYKWFKINLNKIISKY